MLLISSSGTKYYWVLSEGTETKNVQKMPHKRFFSGFMKTNKQKQTINQIEVVYFLCCTNFFSLLVRTRNEMIVFDESPITNTNKPKNRPPIHSHIFFGSHLIPLRNIHHRTQNQSISPRLSDFFSFYVCVIVRACVPAYACVCAIKLYVAKEHREYAKKSKELYRQEKKENSEQKDYSKCMSKSAYERREKKEKFNKYAPRRFRIARICTEKKITHSLTHMHKR